MLEKLRIRNLVDQVHENDAKISLLLEALDEDDVTKDLKLPAEMKGAFLTISSLQTLKSGAWLNDNVVDSYCVYLSNFKYKEKKNFRILSSFFFSSLTKNTTEDGQVNLARVQRPRKLNIFDLDFVIFPILEDYHWSLCVATHLGNLLYCLGLKANETGPYESAIPKPTLLFFDSLRRRGDRSIYTRIKGYIEAEFKKCFNYSSGIPDEELKGKLIRSPRQPNGDDCGVYTLHNIEIFLEKIPWSSGVPHDISDLYEEYPIEEKRFKVFKRLYNLLEFRLGDADD